MSLLAEAQEIAATNSRGPQCTVGALPADLLAEVDDAVGQVAGTVLTYKAIAAALKERGHTVGPHTLSRHHKGECTCGTR